MATYSPANDSEFASMLLSAVSGDIIELRDAVTYGRLLVSNTTASGVTITAQTPQVATAGGIKISNAQGITIDGVKIQCADVPTDSGRIESLIYGIGDCDQLVIKNCLVRCGYEPEGYAPFDPAADHTRYPEFGAPGGDATYNRMAGTYPYGFGSDGSYRGDLTIEDCIFEDLSSGIKFGAAGGVTYKIRRNTIRRMYQDFISFGFPKLNFTPIASVEITGNEFVDAFGVPQDNGNPHCDYIQIFSRDVQQGDDSTTPIANLFIAGNLGWYRPGARGGAQRLFLSDTPPGYPFVGLKCIDNVFISRISSKGITVGSWPGSGSAGSYIYRNTAITNPKYNAPTGTELVPNPNTARGGPSIPAATVGQSALSLTTDEDYQSREFARRNIVERITGTDHVDTRSANIETGLGSVSNLYATHFDGPADWADVDTADKVIDAFKPKAGFSEYGAVRPSDTAATFLARWSGDVKPWSETPAYAGFRTVSQAPKSTLTTSNWAIVHAQNTTLPISIVGGEYRIADDHMGTGAGAWTSATGTVTDGQYLQVRTMSAATNVTQRTVDVTIGADRSTWLLTTLSSVQFPSVVFNRTQRFQTPNGSSLGADTTKVSFALLADITPGTTTDYIIGNDVGATASVRLRMLSGTNKLRFEFRDALFASIAGWDSANNVVGTGSPVELLVSVDLSDPDPLTGIQFWIDGVEQSVSPSSWVADGKIGFSNTNRQLVFGGTGSSTLTGGTVHMFALWVNQFLDFSDPLIRAKCSADLIGATGKGVTGSPPEVFLVGTASEWNSGTAQKGSGPVFAKTAGDVTPGNAAVWPPVLGLALETVTPEPYIAGNPITIRARALGYAEPGETVTITTDGDGPVPGAPVSLPEGVDGFTFDYTPGTAGTHTLGASHSGAYTAAEPLAVSVSGGGAAVAPTVTTGAVSSVTATAATVAGNVTLDGGAAVTARGICYSTSPNPTTVDTVELSGSGTGAFSANLTGLAPATTYYARAFGTNAEGTGYGSDATITTPATIPTVTTGAVSGVTSTTATVAGDVTSDGGSAVTTRGICYSTSPNPTTADSIVIEGTGTGAFSANLTNLAPATTYYARAFGESAEGEGYGSDVTVTTEAAAGPSTATLTNAAVNETKLTITWNDTVTGYAGISLIGSSGTITLSGWDGNGSYTQEAFLSRAPFATESLIVAYEPGDVVDSESKPVQAIEYYLVRNLVEGGTGTAPTVAEILAGFKNDPQLGTGAGGLVANAAAAATQSAIASAQSTTAATQSTIAANAAVSAPASTVSLLKIDEDFGKDPGGLLENAIAARKLAEADQIIEELAGVQVLRTYQRGTSTELLPAKSAKQPGGAALTDPTTERLAGYRE